MRMLNKLHNVSEQKGIVTGDFEDAYIMGDVAISCMFSFYGKVAGSYGEKCYSQITVTVAKVQHTEEDMAKTVATPEVWAAVEDDIECALAYAEQQLTPAEHVPNGEGYHQAVAA